MPTFHQLGGVRFPTDICLFSIREPVHTAVTGVMDKCFQYSFSFLPRVANLDFSSLSVYVTVGCSHSPPYYLKQQIAVIYSSIPFRICPRHPRKTKTQFSCGKSFSRPAAYRIHRVLTSPWFSPSCPKAEVSLFCDGSQLWRSCHPFTVNLPLIPSVGDHRICYGRGSSSQERD